MQLEHNIRYKAHYSIIVGAPDHQGCLFIYNYFKNLVKAFDFGQFHISEHKSARKGDVLKRELMIYHTAYADEIILFRSGLDFLLDRINIYYTSVKVSIGRAGVTREDMVFDTIE